MTVPFLPWLHLVGLSLLAAVRGGAHRFRLDVPGRGPRVPPGTRQLALYPLPAVYLPGSQYMVRNIEQRNMAMCTDRSEFVASLIDSTSMSCASIGSVMRIDSVRAAARDSSGMVLVAQEQSSVLEVRCTCVGRVRLVACENLEAWRRPQKDQYLLADVAEYEDEEQPEEVAAKASPLSGEAEGGTDEAWWMGAPDPTLA